MATSCYRLSRDHLPSEAALCDPTEICIFECLHSKMELSLSEYLSLGNIFLAIVFLLIVNQLIELYQFRNMPPGPRLTSLPFIGNLLSFDSGESLRQSTTRFVYALLLLINAYNRSGRTLALACDNVSYANFYENQPLLHSLFSRN